MLPHLQLPLASFHLPLSWAQLHPFKGSSIGTQVPRSQWYPGANGADRDLPGISRPLGILSVLLAVQKQWVRERDLLNSCSPGGIGLHSDSTLICRRLPGALLHVLL